MYKQTVFLPLATTLVFALVIVSEADARERTSSGTYSNERGTGSFERSVEVLHGQRRSTTTWKNSSGRQGEVTVETTWDPDTRKDALVEKASEGAIAQPEDGSVTQEATVAEPNGETVDIEREGTRHEE